MSFIKNLIGGAKKSEANQQVAIEDVTHAKSMPDTKPDTMAGADSLLAVSPEQILLNQRFSDKTSVLSVIAEKMLTLGLVSENYLPALVAREEKVSTYLINGVAIPHGVNEAKALVLKTGVIIVQVPEGVVWNDNGDVAKLIVGIAAAGSEHLSLLQTLTTVVMDDALALELAQTTDPAAIISALGADLAAEHVREDDFAISAQALVIDEAGMHARPASLIAEHAEQFIGTEIRIRNGERTANAKSMASVLSMGAKKGDQLVVSAQGDAADDAVHSLCELIDAGLDGDDSENATATYSALAGLSGLDNPVGNRLVKGSAASPGIATAPAFVLASTSVEIDKDGTDPVDESRFLAAALEKAALQIDELQQKLQAKAPKEAAILKAQKQLLKDDTIVADSHKLVSHGSSAAWAWHQSVQRQIDSLSTVDDERIRARVADMVDIRDRVIAILQPSSATLAYPQSDFILLARDLTPSQTAGLEGLPIKGICTELGGPNSHMAILARALGIPAIVGLGANNLAGVAQKTPVVIDPQSSVLVIEPDAATLAQSAERLQTWQAIRKAQDACKHEPATTRDGRKIHVVCNIAKPQDAAGILDNGGEGAGLLRTEFLFEAASVEPTVAEQMDALKAIVTSLGARQLVVRTADIGGDKPVSWMNMAHEDNPFLGVRGIRLSFKHEDMFRRQLEAIYRTAMWQWQESGECGLHIMFPMIAKMSEWQKARDIANNVRTQLGAPVLPLGIMIEVPSAVLIADHLAKEVDFFSVGSNDLTQYTLAMDRLHPELCCEADSYHPALLRMIEMTVKAADANGKWVGVCGNMAADPNIAALLVGLGVHELSVSPANVPSVKNIIRSVSFAKLQAKAQKALSLGSSEAVMALYQNHDDLL